MAAMVKSSATKWPPIKRVKVSANFNEFNRMNSFQTSVTNRGPKA